MKIANFFTSKNIKIAILIFFTVVAFVRHKPTIISWDVLAHYLYLPAIFIDNDPGIKNHDAMFAKIEKYQLSTTFYQVVRHDNGNHIIKTTCGFAILHSPFFFVAHLVALATSAPADGFSAPYQFAMMLFSLCFIVIGMIYLRKILIYFFNDNTALLTMIFLTFGTNLFSMYVFLTSIHLILFGLYAFLIWKTIRWHEDPNRLDAFLIGITIGFITLLRPTDAISILIPLLWGVYDLPTFRKKFILITSHWNHLLMLIIGGFLTILPQLLYWKIFTGSFLFYSYATPGEGLDFFTPRIMQVLFSFRKGWLIYTPMMFFAIGGLIPLYKKYRQIFYPVLIFALLNLYLISCWTCWWYADSFGHRAFVHSYALMSLPLGAFIFNLLERKRLFTYLALSVMCLFVLLNLFQTWQFDKQIIDASRMTKEYYWAVFGKIKEPDDRVKDLLLLNRSTTAEDFGFDKDKYLLKKTIRTNYFSMPDVPTERLVTDTAGNQYVVMDSNYVFTPALHIPYHHLTHAEHLYFIIRTQILHTADPVSNPLSVVTHFTHKGGAYKYRAFDTWKVLEHSDTMAWQNIEFFYLSPDVRNPADAFTTYFWYRGKQPVYVKNIEIEVWEPIRGW